MLHQLSSYNFWALVFPSMVFIFWAWHLHIKFFFAKRILSHSYINIKTNPKMTFSLSGLPLYSSSVFVFLSSWQNAFFLTATLVLQYNLNQAHQQKLLPGLRLEDLPGLKILRCYVVKALYIPKIIGIELKNNQAKKSILQLKFSYYWSIHNMWYMQIQALLPTLPPGIE